MAKRDFYEVLGVQRGCDDKELKVAYRKLAMQYHPDRNGGDASFEVKFKEVNEAYECLKDPKRRAVYDRFGHAGLEGAAAGRLTERRAAQCRGELRVLLHESALHLLEQSQLLFGEWHRILHACSRRRPVVSLRTFSVGSLPGDR